VVGDGPAGTRYSIDQVTWLLASHRKLVGRPLLAPIAGESDADLASRLYAAPFVVLAHDAAADPCFTYANLAAQRLFERSWDAFVDLPSRLSAEAPARAERGFIEDYSGVRISSSGRRFRIRRATVWNLSDGAGRRLGQAASFSDWTDCSAE
jgi:hypothetical protein